MMKKIALPIIALLSSAVTLAEQKHILGIKVIEGRVLLQESDKGKAIENNLKVIKDRLENEIKSIEQKIQAEITTISSKSKLMDADTLEREQDKIMRLKKEHELKLTQSQEEFQRKVNIELGKFQKEVQDTIKDISIKNDWDLVIMKESGEVIYSSEKIDATTEVLQILNKKYSDSKKPATTPAVKK